MTTKPIRIDHELHRRLKSEASKTGQSLQDYTSTILREGIGERNPAKLSGTVLRGKNRVRV
jgi:predicted DNA-binding protein